MALNLEDGSVRNLLTNKPFLLPRNSFPRRLVSESAISKKKGFSKIETFHGSIWVLGYISHVTLKALMPLNFI